MRHYNHFCAILKYIGLYLVISGQQDAYRTNPSYIRPFVNCGPTLKFLLYVNGSRWLGNFGAG